MTTSTGMRYGITSDVSGFSRLPKPEFCSRTAARRPDSSSPDASASAAPSFGAGTYR
jgi:hypothetical protein